MNVDKLRRLQAQVRIGGKGTPRRKKKVVHQSAATDDKKLQSSLKKLSVSTIPGIEEVNIIKDDLTVIHFNNPKAQASLSANTFAVTGHGETKKIVELLPEILPQLGQDTVTQLRMFANNISSGAKFPSSRLTKLTEEDEEVGDDDVPLLVSDFEEVAKRADEAIKLVTGQQKDEITKVRADVPEIDRNEEKKNVVELPIAKTTQVTEQQSSKVAICDDTKNLSKEDKAKSKKSNQLSSENTAKNKIVPDTKLEKSEAKSILADTVADKLEKKAIVQDKHVTFDEKHEHKKDDSGKNDNKLSLSPEVRVKQSQQSKQQQFPANQQQKSKQQQQPKPQKPEQQQNSMQDQQKLQMQKKQELPLKKEQQPEEKPLQENLDTLMEQQQRQNQQQQEDLKSLPKTEGLKIQQPMQQQQLPVKKELQEPQQLKQNQQQLKPLQQSGEQEVQQEKSNQEMQLKSKQLEKEPDEIKKELVIKEKKGTQVKSSELKSVDEVKKVKETGGRNDASKDQQKPYKTQEKAMREMGDGRKTAFKIEAKPSTKLKEEKSVQESKDIESFDLKVQQRKDSSVIVPEKETAQGKRIEAFTLKTAVQALNEESKNNMREGHQVLPEVIEVKNEKIMQSETMVESKQLLPIEKFTIAGEANNKDNTKPTAVDNADEQCNLLQLGNTITEGKQRLNLSSVI